MENPYVPFYRPYGMSEEEYNHEVQIAEQKLAEWQQMQNDMNTQQHTPPLYALTKITDTDGLPEGRYIVKNDYGMFEVSFDNKYQFNEEFTDCSDLTHYLRPLPPGTQVLPPGMVAVSEEELAIWSVTLVIEFHEWVGKQGYKISHYAAKGEAVHLHESKGSTPFHELKDNDYCTTKELYQQFIQTKLAQMGE